MTTLVLHSSFLVSALSHKSPSARAVAQKILNDLVTGASESGWAAEYTSFKEKVDSKNVR